MAEPVPRHLIDGARRGEEAAFRELVRIAHPLAFRWALVRLGDADAADDVAQETMLRVHRSLGSFRGDARFTTWLYRLVANAAADHRDRASSRTRLGEALLREADAHAGSTTTPAADRGAIRAVVARFADALPPRQREAFDLVDLQGFEPVEAAEAMGVSNATARVHLHRARRALREALLNEAPEIAEEYG